MKTKAKIAALVMALSVAVSPVSAAAEWQQDPYQNWQWTDNGVPVTGWEFINQNWYYFDANGYMVTGWQKIEGKQYYFNANGTLAVGWAQIGGNWYYFNGSGEMMTGWQRVEGYWYYMNSQGVMQKGWLTYGRDRYYLDENGAMEIGWVEVGDDWYFMNHDGLLQTGLIEVNGEVFYLDGDGKMLTGKQTLPGGTFNFDKETGAATGSKIPKPGKAFDAFGNQVAITVETGSSTSSSNNNSGNSGGSTIIYVPVDDDDEEVQGPEFITPSVSELDAFDAFLESKVPELNRDYSRDFSVSFDKSSHTVTFAIKNLEKRIVNIRYGSYMYDLIDYKDGLVTQFKINDGKYNDLYKVYTNRQGSKYKYPESLRTSCLDEFLNAGFDVFSTMDKLIGKTAQVTVKLGTLETRPYTVNFVQADTLTAPLNSAEMAVSVYVDDFEQSMGNSAYCRQTDEGVEFYYDVPSGYEIEEIGFYGEYEFPDGTVARLPYFVPHEINGNSVTIHKEGTIYTVSNDDCSYQIRIENDRFTLLNMNIESFYYRTYQEPNSPSEETIGWISIQPKALPGIVYDNDGIGAVTDEGLELFVSEEGIYDITMEFNPPITFKGKSISRIDIMDVFGYGYESSAWYNVGRTADSYSWRDSYDLNGRDVTENSATYHFSGFDMTFIKNDDGSFSIPGLSRSVLEDVEARIYVATFPTFSCTVDGQDAEYAWTEEGLVVTNNVNDRQFDINEFRFYAYYPVQINDMYIDSVNSIGLFSDGRLAGSINGGSLDGESWYSFDLVSSTDDNGVWTYVGYDEVAGVEYTFNAYVSEDGKQITFPGVTEDMIEENSIQIQLHTTR